MSEVTKSIETRGRVTKWLVPVVSPVVVYYIHHQSRKQNVFTVSLLSGQDSHY